MNWESAATTTHQDHVIAHTIDTTVLGYLVLDEALHLLLDIGFIWTIYLDGQMVLLPQRTAIQELGVDAATKQKINEETLLLEQQEFEQLQHFTPTPVDCRIKDVQFFSSGEHRRLVLIGEEGSLAIETSLETGGIEVKAGLK